MANDKLSEQSMDFTVQVMYNDKYKATVEK